MFNERDWAETPSRRHDVKESIEISERALGIHFLNKLGHQTRLKHSAIATGCLYFHIFFFRRSLMIHDKMDVATACLFLAAKCDENRRRLKDICESAYYLKNKKKIEKNGKMIEDE